MFNSDDRIFSKDQVLEVMQDALNFWDWEGFTSQEADLKAQLEQDDPVSFMQNSDDDGVCVDLSDWPNSVDIYDYISEKLG